MYDEKTIRDRLSEASLSDDLSHRRTTCDVDYLGALGAAGIKNPLGSALMALDLTQDPKYVKRALHEVVGRTQVIARAESWKLVGRKLVGVAREALLHYLNPVCVTCHGVGMVGVDRSKPAEYHPRPCPTCGGDKKRPISEKIRAQVMRVLASLEADRRNLNHGVRSKMRLSVDVE